MSQSATTTDYDHWVWRRLSADKQPEHWFDRFDFQAAAAFFDALGGLIASSGKTPTHATIKNVLQHADHGYELARQGQDAIRRFLSDHQERFSPTAGQRQIFGPLYLLLAERAPSSELRPFRQFLRDHIRQTWPLAPGDEILGEPVLSRRLVSVGAVARLFNADVDKVQQSLAAADAQPQISKLKPDDWVTFDREAAARIQIALNLKVSDSQFCAALHISPELFASLRDGGLLERARSGDGSGWSALAGQAIVEELLTGAHPIGRLTPDLMSIERAADHLACGADEIVRRIREGRFPRIARHLKHSGFASIFVDIAGLDGRAITAEVFAQSLGLAFSEMLSFFRKGHSPARIMQRDIGRKDRITLSPEQVASFHANFMSFRELALAATVGWNQLDHQLREQGIAPVLGCQRIYRRSEVKALLT